MAEVTARKRGKYWQYCFEGAPINGKRKQYTKSGFPTKKSALEAGVKAKAEYDNSGSVFSPSEISATDYFDYWYKNYVQVNCKYNTQERYEVIIRLHLKPLLGHYRLSSLTPTVLQTFINNKFLAGYSRNQLFNVFTTLSGALKYAVYPCCFIRENPMQYVSFPKYDHGKAETDHKIITAEEFQRIITRFPPGSSFYIPLMIGYFTGCRIGEVMGLTWQDIDLVKGYVDVNKILYRKEKAWYFGSTKTASSVRKIKIGDTLVNVLRKHRTWQHENKLRYGRYWIQQYQTEDRQIHSISISPESSLIPVEMVCTKESGEMITPDSFKYASRVIHTELGIIFNFHSLRHTHATMLIQNGANIKDVQARLGHSNIQTTLQVYTHATDESAKRSVEIFEKYAHIG